MHRSVRSLSRGLALITELNVSGPSTAQQLARRSRINRTTCYRLLQTLRQEGYVTFDGKSALFGLTPQVRRLSDGLSTSDVSSQAALPAMFTLLKAVSWPSDFAVFELGRMMIHESTHSFSPFSVHRSMVGRDRSLVRSALGRAVLTAAPPALRQEMLEISASLVPEDVALVRDRRYVQRFLSRTRRDGYASSIGETEHGISAIAVPIEGNGPVLGSLNIVFFTSAMTPQVAAGRYLRSLKQAAREIERRWPAGLDRPDAAYGQAGHRPIDLAIPSNWARAMFRRLEMIVAIDTHRNFNRAARALGISQPSLTRALQTLERELGVRLFERDKTECQPTEFGRIMLERSRRILSEMAEARREIELLQGLETGEFRIGAGSFATQLWLGAAIGQLNGAHPRLKVRSAELLWYQLPAALMASEIDAAVGEASELPLTPDIVVSRLPRRPGVLICRAGHPLARQGAVGLADLAAYPLAGPRLPRRIALHLPAASALGALAPDGLSFQPAIFCETLVGMGDLVEQSDALGIFPRAAVARLRQRPTLAVLPFEPAWLCTEQAVMWRGDRMAHPALKAFREAARRCEAAVMGGKGSLRAVA